LGTRQDVSGGSPPAQIYAKETEIFVPSLLAHGRKMIVNGLDMDDKYSYDEMRQTLYIVHHDHSADAVHTVRVSFDPPLLKHQPDSVLFFCVTVVIAILCLGIGYLIAY
jgi:hypothetical protein